MARSELLRDAICAKLEIWQSIETEGMRFRSIEETGEGGCRFWGTRDNQNANS